MTNRKSIPDVLLGQHSFENNFLSEKLIESLKTSLAALTSPFEKFIKISEAIYNLVKESPQHSYLLPTIVDFLGVLNESENLKNPYRFVNFEFWLNHFSGISKEEQLIIRGKISGRYIPRQDYQTYFPVGMDSYHSGSHFVAGHFSPDIDTTVASFWGWLDAFSARIGTGLHYWSLPGEEPDSPVTTIIKGLFGKQFFEVISRTNKTLFLTASDLLSKPESQTSSSASIQLDAEIGEIREKITESNSDLTVLMDETVVGVIKSSDLDKKILATVTQRDFCNHNEIKMPSYMEVISVVDHHKSNLHTTGIPCVTIADAQSSNVLIAEKEFELNDRYSLGGISEHEIKNQLEELSQSTSLNDLRIKKRLLQRWIAALSNQPYFVHPKREYDSYLCFLYAILDDTDLLTKVTNRDVLCVANLLNRMKSLSLGREVEIIHFNDLIKDSSFAKKAAKRLLINPDLHSLYKKIYDQRASDIDSQILACKNGDSCSLFTDTKEQNECVRVGQIKLFSSNVSLFQTEKEHILHFWCQNAKEIHERKPAIDLHLQMVSTVPNADEVCHENPVAYSHQDELWLWVPQNNDHLSHFLKGFSKAGEPFKNSLSVEFFGPHASQLKKLFFNCFYEIPSELIPQKEFSVIVLRFKAGAVNSRKSMITPFLPIHTS